MAKVGFVSLDTVIDDYIEDNNLDQDLINYEQLKRWATDCTQWLCTSQQLRYRLGLFVTNEHGKVELPDDYRYIQQVAYRIRKNKKDCTTKEGMRQFIQEDFNTGLELEINVKCPKCGVKSCECGDRAMIVDVDQLWIRQNMEGIISDKAKRYRYGRGQNHPSNSEEDTMRDQFRLMRHSISDFRNTELNNCLELNFRCGDYSYVIDYPYISTDLPKNSEVLVSYLAAETDSDGNVMVSEHSDSMDAIAFHLNHKRFLSKYSETLEQKFLQASELFEFKRERAIELSRADLAVPEGTEIYSVLGQVFYSRMSNETDKLIHGHCLHTNLEDTYLRDC